MQIGFYFDQSRCVGCHACAVACKEWHGISAGYASFRRVHTIEVGKFPNVFVSHLSLSCMHCIQPKCVPACPNNAVIKRGTDGIVVVDHASCMSKCGLCLDACPYQSPQFGDSTVEVMQKCDLCLDRIIEKMKPICVEACPLRALDVGPMEELERMYGTARTAIGFSDSKNTEPCIVFNPRL